MSKNKRIIIATGGTGGHIFPAQALAEALVADGFKVNILSGNSYAKYHGADKKFAFNEIAVAKVQKGVFSLTSAAFFIALGVVKSIVLMLFLRPKVVVAFGGYATFPTLIAAVILRKTIILHEQNAHLGKVNRIFAKYANKIATSFKNTSAIKKEFAAKAKHVGNPVRSQILQLSKTEYKYPELNKTYKSKNNLGYNLVLSSDFEEVKKIEDDHFNILVIGGSGGAKIFSDILPRAFFNIRTDLKNQIGIIQQCRADLLDATFSEYKDLNLNITLKSFFGDIDQQIKKAHLVIARSGSSSIAELTIAKKPMILVPFAKSADNHQEKNAIEIEKNGGATILRESDFTISNITNIVEKLIDNPKLLKRMSKDAFTCSNIKAVDKLVKLVKDS